MPLTRKLASKSLIKQPTEQDIFAGSVVNMTTNSFVGDGLTTVFTLSSTPFSIVNTQVFISGVYQEKSTYTIVGTTLTFSTAPPLNATIEVMVGTNYSVGTPANGAVTLAKLANDVIQFLLPTGSVLSYAGSSAPSGYLLCDGTSYSTATYPALFAAIGYAHGGAGANFNVPDYRGRFLRGVTGASANDPDTLTRTAMNVGGNTGNNVGSVQGHAFQTHNHTFPTDNAGAVNLGANAATGGNNTVAPAKIVSNASASGATSQASANETRPINAYVNYIIKT